MSFLEPFCGHLSPKIDKVSKELTFKYPHEGPCVDSRPGVVRRCFEAVAKRTPYCVMLVFECKIVM